MKKLLAVMFLVAAPLFAQDPVTIPELPDGSAVSGTDEFAADQSGANEPHKVSATDIKTFVDSDAITDVYDCTSGDCNQIEMGESEWFDGGIVDGTTDPEMILTRGADCSTVTAGGRICYDTDDYILYVGRGDGAKIIGGAALQIDTVVADTMADADHGDVAWSGSVASVQDFTIASEAQGDVLFFDGSNWIHLAPGTDGWFLKTQGAAANPVWAAASGGGGGPKEVYFPAAALRGGMAPDNSFPSLAHEEGTNIDMDVLLYDDTTDQCAGGTLHAPGNIDTSGTVTFHIRWYSGSVTTGDVMFDVRHKGIGDNESWDQALTTEEAGAVTTAGTVDLITYDTWTETVSNLGWTADELVEFLLCRDADSTGTGTDDLSGNASVIDFTIEIPRS